MWYRVLIERVQQQSIEVEAQSKEEAETKAEHIIPENEDRWINSSIEVVKGYTEPSL